MEMFVQKPNSPGWSLIMLIGLTLICSIVVQAVVILVLLLVSGDVGALMNLPSLMAGEDVGSSTFFYFVLAASSLGTFLLPALFLQRIERHMFRYFPGSTHRQGLFFLLALTFLIAFNPVMALVSEWNMNMTLPDSVADVQQWMRAKEDEAALLTQQLVMTDEVARLMANLLVIAVLPAICEEYFFRGALQHIGERLFKNHHLAIWATAVVFSAIHFQFFGFFPRVLLGAIFGYMLVWTQNIWVPIFAHFLNNAAVTIIASVYASQGKSYQELVESSESYPVVWYILGFTASIAVGMYFYKKAIERKKEQEEWKTVG